MNKQNIIYVAGGLLSLTSCNETKQDEKPLNIVYILADDLGYGDLSCTGQTKYETHNIDKLAAEGMLFTQHYAGCTVSAPSRSAFMTGMHTGHTPIRGNKELPNEGQQPIPENTYTVAKMLKEAGYVTGAFGKWGLGAPGSEGDPINQGFDRFYGYNCQREAHRYYPKHLWDNNKKVVFEGNSTGVPTEYAPDYIQREALRFIEGNKDKSFFLYLAYTLPHAELLVPEDTLFKSFVGNFEESPYRPKGAEYGKNVNVMAYSPQEYPYAAFATMVSRLDMYVGQVVEKLEELGIADNTVIMFTSDNGPHTEGGANPKFFKSSGPFKGTKRDLTEGGIRLPLIVWAPGRVQNNVTNNHICASWDMLPTFADMANIKLSDSIRVDGISIYPTLIGDEKNQISHDYLFWEFHEKTGDMAVRKGNWKAIKSNIKSGNPKIKLFDLSNDIHEDDDLSEKYPEVVLSMDSIMSVAHMESSVFPLLNE